MEKQLTWNKGILESNYQIYEAGQIKCTLFFDTWRSEAKAITQQKSYLFKDDGFFDPTTKILNQQNEVIGTINYDVWKTKAVVNLISGEMYSCNLTNLLQAKWMITNFTDKQINYDSSTSSGNVMANTDDELMLLSGFYIKEHFTKIFMLIIFIVLFLPIITRGVF